MGNLREILAEEGYEFTPQEIDENFEMAIRLNSMKLNNPNKCCKECKHVKRLDGYKILAECGLSGLTVNINALEVCKYYEKFR